MTLNRDEAAHVATATVAILNDGRYMAPGGQQVEIAGDIAAAVAGTVAYPPEAPLPAVAPDHHTTEFTVRNETTLAAARRLAGAGLRPVALDFASAKRPGGGFLNGALAQQESLARASGLYACLDGNAMYAYHRQRKDSMYSNYAIYKYKDVQDGANAFYIPALAQAPRDLFGIAFVTTDGQVFEMGDTQYAFAIESISKVFSLALVIEELGAQAPQNKVGASPTGLPFNSVIAVELHNGQPLSPLVNAGAMSTVSLLPAMPQIALQHRRHPLSRRRVFPLIP